MRWPLLFPPPAGLLAMLLVAGCTVAERLQQVGSPPPLRPIDNPVDRGGYRPVTLPMPEPEPQTSAGPSSLWRSGARGFFKDQRARRVGDILTVQVTISDKAELNNQSTRSRKNADDLGLSRVLGLETRFDNVLPSPSSSPIDPASLVAAGSSMSNLGRGAVEREEQIRLNVAALITQVLPNGNLVVEGRQEVRVNFEIREILVAGVVRPEDITPRNTITHEKIAELRVGYGGRGQITDVQQPRYGAQILDILLPY
ncbi:flagellar basal body L-ring protein FlgH [Marinimicrococcus flavescens]|uniref:Flagellar L-ring protein n=1 Tax=Marinimicrococcus flavescens TaxID=3031815 RepID=A0AAP3V2J8_9PROT|nr:flagellar basal body L-ring protein FlgH [Marinimicrococcus flavescens]